MTLAMRMRRLGALAVVCWLLGAMLAPPSALADAAGPTDYRSEIVSIEPASAPIDVMMIGGDAFISLEQLEPVEVVVLGYRGEDYLRFDADGTVVENRRSPSTWLNAERYGTDETLPSFVDHEAPPEWRRVADNGRFAWHDHRSHWMNPTKPPGAEAGDQVLEATVPLLVDGELVTVTVASFLLESPSRWPGIVGAALALVAGAVALRAGRLSLAMIVGAVAAVALTLGVIAFGSVPSETEPDRLLWLLPLVAVVAMVSVASLRNRLSTTVYLDGLAVASGATLAAWGFTRLDALNRSLIPSDAPAWLDRLTIGGALIIGAIATARGLYGLVRPERLIEPSER